MSEADVDDLRVHIAGQRLQLKATIAAPFSTKLLARAIEF